MSSGRSGVIGSAELNTGAPPTVIRIDAQQGPLASYVAGLRAILSGDDKQLRQLFETRLTGNADTWTLQLLPRGPLPRRGIQGN